MNRLEMLLRISPRENDLEKCIEKIALDRKDHLPIVMDDCVYCKGFGEYSKSKDCFKGEFSKCFWRGLYEQNVEGKGTSFAERIGDDSLDCSNCDGYSLVCARYLKEE